MAIIFPNNPGASVPTNTFSPTSTPPNTYNNLTYIWDPTLQVWTSTAGGGGGGGVTAITGTAPIVIAGTATNPDVTITAATNAAPGSVQLATAAEAAAGTNATKALTPSDGVPKVLANMTGAAIIPGGDDTERAAITTPAAGMLRYNDQAGFPAVMEYYDGIQWVDLATGGGGFALGDWTRPATGALVGGNISGNQFQAVAYGNGRYMALSGTGAPGTVQSKTSTDGGYTWTNPGGSFPAAVTQVIYLMFANGVFVALANGGPTFTSTDGVAWTTGASGPTGTSIAGGNGTFILNGGSTLYRSTDGLNWGAITQPPGPSTGVKAVAKGPANEYLAVIGSSGQSLATSLSTDNGNTWSALINVTLSGFFDPSFPIRAFYDGTSYFIYYQQAGGGNGQWLRGDGLSAWNYGVPGSSSAFAGSYAVGAPGQIFLSPGSGAAMVCSKDSGSSVTLSSSSFGTAGLATDGNTLVAHSFNTVYVAPIL